MDPDKEWNQWGADLGAPPDARMIDEDGQEVKAMDPRRVDLVLDQ